MASRVTSGSYLEQVNRAIDHIHAHLDRPLRLQDVSAVTSISPTPRGEIGRFRFPPLVVAQVEIRGGIDLELRALQWLYGTWLPWSPYVPDDHPGFESWIGLPFAHGTDYFEIDLQLPVRRLRRGDRGTRPR